MTTKWKVIVGFLLVICLLVGVAALGYVKLHDASVGFDAYRVQARTSVDANGADALMRGVLDHISRFRLDLDQQHIKQAHALADRAANHYLAIAKKVESDPRELALLDRRIERIKQLMKLADEMQQKLVAGNKMFDEQLLVASREMTGALQGMSAIARQRNNAAILELIEQAFAIYANARVWVRHYVDVILASSAVKAEQEFADLAAILQKMESL